MTRLDEHKVIQLVKPPFVAQEPVGSGKLSTNFCRIQRSEQVHGRGQSDSAEKVKVHVVVDPIPLERSDLLLFLVEDDGVIIKKGQAIFKITPDEKIVEELPEEIAARRREITTRFLQQL